MGVYVYIETFYMCRYIITIRSESISRQIVLHTMYHHFVGPLFLFPFSRVVSVRGVSLGISPLSFLQMFRRKGGKIKFHFTAKLD